MDLSMRMSSAAGLADPEIMEQNLQEWIIHRCVPRAAGRNQRTQRPVSHQPSSIPPCSPALVCSEHVRKKRYQIIAAPVCEPMARRLQAKYPERYVSVALRD